MPRKSNHHDSKDAESCPCGCCRWHTSSTLRAVLAIMFVLMVIAIVASLVFASRPYFGNSVLTLMGVVFLVVFAGWVVTFFCSCRGAHWSRHGYTREHDPAAILKRRYAAGEIGRKEYEEKMRHMK